MAERYPSDPGENIRGMGWGRQVRVITLEEHRKIVEQGDADMARLIAQQAQTKTATILTPEQAQAMYDNLLRISIENQNR